MHVEGMVVGRYVDMAADALRYGRIVVLLVAAPAVQIGDGEGRAFRMAVGARALGMVRVIEADGPLHRTLAYRQAYRTLHGRYDVSQVGGRVARRAFESAALLYVMTSAAIGRVPDQKGAVLRSHLMAFETRQLAVGFVAEGRVGELGRGGQGRGDQLPRHHAQQDGQGEQGGGGGVHSAVYRTTVVSERLSRRSLMAEEIERIPSLTATPHMASPTSVPPALTTIQEIRRST